MPERSRKSHHASIWGVVLLFVGIVLLLQNFDVLPWSLWGTLWRFWPVLLIVIGLDILAGRYNPWLASALVLAVLGACLGLAIWQHGPSPGPGSAVSEYSQPLGDLERAEVRIDFAAGSLKLASLSPGSPNLVEASCREGRIRAEFERQGKVGQLRLTNEKEERPPWKGIGAELEVNLSPDISLALQIKSAATNLNLDLGQLKATKLELNIDAGNCKLRMPSQGSVQVLVEANAANVEITIPEEMAARIGADVNLAALEIDESRFLKRDDHYISPNFESSENQIYLRINCNAGRVKVN
ncbi:MAG: hypothetical protein DRI26_03130 [Chloroflexi bacterium]|nr:MAG: hypothetical protein DRI26_03130 [Chloroflexota bacterium]